MKAIKLIVLIIGLSSSVGCYTLSGNYHKNKGNIHSICDDIMGKEIPKENRDYKLCVSNITAAQSSIETKNWVKVGVITQWASFFTFLMLLSGSMDPRY